MCPYHVVVIRNLAEKDHTSDRDSTRAAESIRRQCRECVTGVVIVGRADA